MKTRATELLGVELPIVQSGMRWVSRAKLAAAVSNAGGLGVISAHTQPNAEALRREIQRTRTLTSKPFGVNLTLLAANTGVDIEGFVRVVGEEGISVVETAGGSPAKYLDVVSWLRNPLGELDPELVEPLSRVREESSAWAPLARDGAKGG